MVEKEHQPLGAHGERSDLGVHGYQIQHRDVALKSETQRLRSSVLTATALS
jgi:hypothetical protein